MMISMIEVGTMVTVKKDAWTRVFGDNKKQKHQLFKVYDPRPRLVMFVGESTRAGMYMLDSPWHWWLEGDLEPVFTEKHRSKKVEQ